MFACTYCYTYYDIHIYILYCNCIVLHVQCTCCAQYNIIIMHIHYIIIIQVLLCAYYALLRMTPGTGFLKDTIDLVLSVRSALQVNLTYLYVFFFINSPSRTLTDYRSATTRKHGGVSFGRVQKKIRKRCHLVEYQNIIWSNKIMSLWCNDPKKKKT